MPDVVKRFSLLRRNPSLTREKFSHHYREVHGPLAASQSGFREFAYRYDQNHIEANLLGDSEPLFDGITVTFQVPRPDYRRGFFQHPDYARVRTDEEYLFDLTRTVSFLGKEAVVVDGTDGAKAIVACRGAADRDLEASDSTIGAWPGLRRVVRNDLDPSSASALGIGSASIEYGRLWELWFDSPAARIACFADRSFAVSLSAGSTEDVLLALAVRDLTIFRREP